jgi:hypothetical protein
MPFVESIAKLVTWTPKRFSVHSCTIRSDNFIRYVCNGSSMLICKGTLRQKRVPRWRHLLQTPT